MNGKKVTISEPTSKRSDVIPQDTAPPPAPVKMTGEIKEPFDAVIFRHRPLFQQTATGFSKPKCDRRDLRHECTTTNKPTEEFPSHQV
jgi:hypothetical protein